MNLKSYSNLNSTLIQRYISNLIHILFANAYSQYWSGISCCVFSNLSQIWKCLPIIQYMNKLPWELHRCWSHLTCPYLTNVTKTYHNLTKHFSFLPTTLFTPARDLNSERVPIFHLFAVAAAPAAAVEEERKHRLFRSEHSPFLLTKPTQTIAQVPNYRT